MKPAPFTYHRPGRLEEALELLATLPNARVLAGGQSLLPMLNLRMATPEHIIDLGRVSALAGITETAEGISIGAMTTQRAIERSESVRARCPLLIEALAHVGHQATRNRGTIGGSLCHLDPAAELPVVASALDARLTIASRNGQRSIRFDEFPAGYLTTQLAPDEILTGIDFPQTPAGSGWAFEEFSQRAADFAVVCVAVLVTIGSDARVRQASIAIGGLGPAPARLHDAESTLAGHAWDAERVGSAAQAATRLPCGGDEVNPAEYRSHLAGVLTRRALDKAYERGRTRV
ncbi:MAG: xanthine dehydrogenase family protein subunit M [Betaproteobacteria bacterium]|nr:xanthine dehydrogenase family protein subunit M [Betaproteobacteria bacterium]